MQINPLPTPNVTPVNAHAISQALPQVQALAAAPVTQQAITPTNKAHDGKKTRGNEDRRKGGDRAPDGETPSTRGHIVNTSA